MTLAILWVNAKSLFRSKCEKHQKNIIMLSVKHERPSQRLKHRVSVPIKVELVGEGGFETLNWSLNGICLKNYSGIRQVGDKVDLEISIPFQGFDISFTCECEVVRREQDQLALKFLSIGDRGRDLMTYFLEEIIRGSVSSTDEVLRRIDTPVTPVTTTQEASPTEDMPVKRFSWNAVRMVFIHLSVGIIVLGYGGYFIYKNFFMLNVSTAVISAPVNPLLSPINGYLTEIMAEQGQYVLPNETLMKLSNPELDSQIDFARINVDRKMMELRVRQAEYQAEIQKNEDFKRIAETKLNMIERSLDHLRTQEILENMRHDIIEENFIQGQASEIGVIDSSLRKVEKTSKLDEARELLRSRRLLLDSIERGTLIHDNIESKLSQSRAGMEFAEDQLILAKDELSALKNQQRWMHIAAPAEGQIAQWLRAPGTAVKKGEKLALFELNDARVIKAFLTPAEVLKVGLGDRTTVYFPSLDRQIEAVVSHIDATSGMLSAKDIDFIWRRPKEPSARVTMQFVGLSAEEIRQSFPSGLPATVVFEQRGENESDPRALLSSAKSWIQSGYRNLLSLFRDQDKIVPANPEDIGDMPTMPERLKPNTAPKYPAERNRDNRSKTYVL